MWNRQNGNIGNFATITAYIERWLFQWHLVTKEQTGWFHKLFLQGPCQSVNHSRPTVSTDSSEPDAASGAERRATDLLSWGWWSACCCCPPLPLRRAWSGWCTPRRWAGTAPRTSCWSPWRWRGCVGSSCTAPVGGERGELSGWSCYRGSRRAGGTARG